MSDLISRHKAIDIVRNIIVKEVTPAYMLIDKAEVMTELMMMPPAKLDLQPTCNNLVTDCISRQEAIDALNGIINRFEQILRDIRESKVDDSVCGMCEYDGAFVGQSGDWYNECPGFEKNDCFKLSDECRKRWLESVKLPSAQPDYTAIKDEIQRNIDDFYNSKHHAQHVSSNGRMIAFGLELALDIVKDVERREDDK